MLCADQIIQHHTVSLKEVNYLFPLWLLPEGTERRTLPNISPTVASSVAGIINLNYDDGLGERQRELVGGTASTTLAVSALPLLERGRGDLAHTFGPRDFFDWTYAVMHSPAYRMRYADFLRSNFPRVPIPATLKLFEALVPVGTRLVGLHLLDERSSNLLTDPKDIRFVGNSAAEVEKGFPKWKNGRAAINCSSWFEDVPEAVWSFHIGGYQVCEKWLKDRRERTLSDADKLHYRRIVVALSETIRLMKEIDEIIDEHGGWPAAFATMNPIP